MAYRIPDDLIEEVRINNDIVDVVSEYVRLEKRGKNYFGVCPFHKEKTPSFSVEPSKQIFYCFGCGKGGNVFQFVMNVERLEYIDAVRQLADRAKISLPEAEDPKDLEKARLKQEIMQINLQAARFFYELLRSPKGEKAWNYLQKRGIGEQTVKKFGLGYCSEEWDGLYKFLQTKGFSQEFLRESGLILPNRNGGFYDRFRARIMFPIFDVRGGVIAFGGRVMDDSQPKYMNSPETPAYNKGKHLYALNYAKNSGDKRLIVVEGYMDTISLHQSGITNVVASLGTAMTESQGRILKKYAEEIVISYDADTAGQAATMRGLDLLSDIGCKVKVLMVPDGKDPDEYIRKNGPNGFKKLVESAYSLVEYKIRNLRAALNTETTDGKIEFLNKTADVLSRIDNHMEREMYIKKLAQEYEISEESMYSEVYRRIRPRGGSPKKSSAAGEIPPRQSKTPEDETDQRLLHDERFILSLLCTDNSMYKVIRDKISSEDFTDPENKRLAGFVFDRLGNNKGIVPGELLNAVNPQIAGEFARILNDECPCDDNKKAILGKIRDIGLNKLLKRQKQIFELLKNKGALSEGDVEILKRELTTLMLKIKDMKNMA